MHFSLSQDMTSLEDILGMIVREGVHRVSVRLEAGDI